MQTHLDGERSKRKGEKRNKESRHHTEIGKSEKTKLVFWQISRLIRTCICTTNDYKYEYCMGIVHKRRFSLLLCPYIHCHVFKMFISSTSKYIINHLCDHDLITKIFTWSF